MTHDELIEHGDGIAKRHVATMELVDQIDAASAETMSIDRQADTFAEGLFLRAFTAYENDVERLFLHYVTRGGSLSGAVANSYLRVTDETLARKLTLAGRKFLSWAKPEDIRTTAENYIEHGWPITEMMNAKSQELSDCLRVRNHIAHSSRQSLAEFKAAQRNLLHTERIFPITAGQFLRIRNARLKKLHIGHYLDVMYETLCAILDPPP